MAEEDHRITEEHLIAAIADQIGLETSEAEKNVKVKSFDVSEGSKKGDNFACVMKAVSVEAEVNGQPQSFGFMAKCVPMNPMREKWIVEANIFLKEVLAYTHLLPAFQKMQPKLGLPICHVTEEKVMIMNNLKTKGFKMVDKRVGLDMEHIKLLLNQLAMLHSVSHHWVQTYPGGMAAAKKDHPMFFHDEGWMQQGNEEMKQQFDIMISKMIEGSAAVVGKFAPDRPELAEKMLELAKKVPQTMDEVARAKDGQFCAVLHGDCWNNNFMFLYDDEGKLETMKMLDYQLMRYGCITLDLVYFLCTSTSPAMRKEHLEDILVFYHTQLVFHLGNLGYDESVYSFQSFKKDFDDCFIFGYICGTFIAQVILSEKAAEAGGMMDMDDCKTDEDMNKKMENLDVMILNDAHDNVPLQERLVGLAEEAVERGLI